MNKTFPYTSVIDNYIKEAKSIQSKIENLPENKVNSLKSLISDLDKVYACLAQEIIFEFDFQEKQEKIVNE